MAAKKSSFTLLLTVGICLLSVLTGRSQDFVPIKGTYYGLFFEADGAWSHSSGQITISTTSRGSYSARLQRGRDFFRFSGFFDADGHASRQIFSFFSDPLTVELQVDSEDPDVIFGTVSDGDWVADLFADRAVFDGRSSVSPDAGRYTLVLPGDFTSSDTPGGNSFATVNVDRAGRIQAFVDLADGWRFSQSTRVSKDGRWPLYFPVYWGDGTIHGWLQFNSDDSAISGDVTWIKPRIYWDWYYPRGFEIIVSATGSQYVRPSSGTKIIDIETGTIEFNGGNLQEGITNQVSLDFNNRLHNLGPNDTSFKFSLSNGSFKGYVADPFSWDWIPFRGVVLQDQAVATGFFPGWDETGEVWLQGD
jgi:hypothetical protein